ncbi:choice-of-anchor Q domain-containing protein [Runella limosa]|uniref:choice-of-anchor Q domain-containing protein n=1 Tax=Runella limosa TaxID=370978 RepID=UPI00040DA1B1|nr:choice-of-anchor Q domain-containing protein [Runella limosa]
MTYFTLLIFPRNRGMYVTLLLAMMSFLSHSQTIRYVKQNGTGDGSSWDNASADLQGMINATGTAEVWVAKGTYKPGTSRNASFSMKAGVKIYGSFAGTETNLSERTTAVMAANKSILSGDLNGDDVITGSGATLSITNNGENCYHVVYNVSDGSNRLTTDNSLLDGFTITGGNADAYGGGMYNQSSSPNLTNITFFGNNASNGGGLFNLSSSPSLSNGTFEKNQANKGGGVNGTSSSLFLNNVLFKGNKASAGGGMYNLTSFTPNLTNVIFKENKADGDGGGICNDNASINLNNVYFIDNQASYGGGMYGVNSYGNRINVVFLGNIASVNGGGVYNTGSSYPLFKHVTFIGNRAVNGAGVYNTNQTGPIRIINGVFWGNTSSETGPDIKQQSGSISLSYCLLQLESSNYSSGFTLGDGMRYGQNPLFVNAADPDGADNVLGTSDDGLQLLPCSPVINAGTNADAASTDIIGNPRSFGGTVDMGAYESQSPPVTGTRLYVNAAAAANGDGSTWATAYTDLQTALTNARLCSQITEIWVAKGTYKPGTSRNASFSMKAGVKIHGSFAGTETNLSDRTAAVMAANKSILSGDLNGDDATAGKGENSYHVILNDNNGLTTSNSLLDGFTITGGNASEDSGGGMYNKYSSPSLSNLSFVGNESYLLGGGVSNVRSSPSFVNCSFLGNKASFGGGGMGNEAESSPILVNCSILGNEASKGGGIFNMLYCAPSLVNCSLSGNESILSGGGISSMVGSPVNLKNCILWGNKNEFGSYNEVESDDSDSNPTYASTLVEGLAVGGFQGTENPLFVNQPSAGLGTSGDLRLQACSPVLNAGNNADNSTTIDLGGNNRKVGTIDLGAYEYQSAPPAVVTPTVSISHPTTCGGTEGSIRLSGFLKTTTYSVIYKKNNVLVSAANFTSDGSGVITLPNLGAGSYNGMVATYGACVSNAVTTAVVLTDPAKPTATISGATTVCQNSTSPSITFTGQNGTGAYTFTYKLNEGTSQTATTTSENSVTVPVTTGTAGEFTYRLVSVSNPNNCSQSQTGSAVVTVNPLPTATISGTTTVCQNSPTPSITFTGANATAPYTFTYKINDGAAQTVKTVSGNSVTVPVSTTTVGEFTYTLLSVSESSSTGCSQVQSGSVVVKVQGKPTITLSTLQQTLNEGNSQTFCDIDANPVNSLQFNVSGLCVVGSPVWRVQVGSGSWSNWTISQPVTQPSNNQPHRYQAACDANCPSTYTSPIELTINNRASVPQNVSLLVDGVTVLVGESKEVCSLVTIPLTFNANCAAGEVTLYSVDGGEYSSGVPTGLVDNQFHNYRVRCRKSDGTPSCVESESGVMRLKLVTIPSAPTVSLSSTSSCDATASFSGLSNCGSLRTVWYNATTNVALPNLPSTVPSQTTSYYARCQTENGCVSEKSNVVTFTLTPTQVAPVITASQEIVCTGTSVTISANCPAGSQTFWNTGVTTPSFEVAFNNVTKQTYWAKCLFEGGCQSSESVRKDIYWNAFVVTLINVGESKSSVKVNDRAAWAGQFITRDGGPELEQSTQQNPTLYFVENANKIAPRYWTINVEACGLSTDGSLTFDMLATPEMGVIRSFNTHENNAPYFMYANREGWTELYAQNHPAYGFYQDNGAGGNVYDAGLPKGLYKLGVRYWDQKGWGSIYPSTRKPQGNVLAYQEYWFRIQSKAGIGVGAVRVAESREQGSDHRTANGEGQAVIVPPSGGRGLLVLPNPVTNILRLEVQDSKGQEVKAILLDAAGQEVLSRKFVPETNMHHEEFGVSSLANGLYFLQVQTFEQQATLKVVKNE